MSYTNLIKVKKLPHGGMVFVAPFRAAGTVSIVGSIRGGTRVAERLVSGLKEGSEFSKMHAEMLLAGTQKKHKQALQIALDRLGVSLSFSAERDRLLFSARVRSARLPELLTLIAEILIEPAFPESELALLKKRERAALSLEAQDTRTQAQIHFSRLIYPKSHPNRLAGTDESRTALGNVTAEALREYHRKALDASSLIVALSGDVVPQRASKLVAEAFAGMPKQPLKLLPPNPAKPLARGSVSTFIKDKAGIDYVIGMATGIDARHPDYTALLLGMQILGNPGSFTGRLMQTVREAEGLTYSAYSYLAGFERGLDGYLFVWSSFAPQLFAKGKAGLEREISLITTKGVSAEELRRHQELFAARWHVSLANSMSLARAVHGIALEGRPLSYLDSFPKRIGRLTLREVNRVLKKYLKPEYLSASAAGPVIEKKGKKR